MGGKKGEGEWERLLSSISSASASQWKREGRGKERKMEDFTVLSSLLFAPCDQKKKEKKKRELPVSMLPPFRASKEKRKKRGGARQNHSGRKREKKN